LFLILDFAKKTKGFSHLPDAKNDKKLSCVVGLITVCYLLFMQHNKK